MKLLRIRPKNSKFSYIEFDEQLRGILNYKILQKLDLEMDAEIEIDQDLADIIEQEIIASIWKKFLNWLAIQEKSINQSRQYLRHIPLAEDLVENIIDKACQLNYLNNERFTRLLIESFIDKRKSFNEIKSKLYEHKIPTEMINKLLQELYDQDSQEKVLESLIEQLFSRWNIPEVSHQEKKICDYLARRGFDYHEVKNIFYRIYNAQEDHDK